MKVQRETLFTEFMRQIVYIHGNHIDMTINTENNKVTYRVRSNDREHIADFDTLEEAINDLNKKKKKKGNFDVIEVV